MKVAGAVARGGVLAALFLWALVPAPVAGAAEFGIVPGSVEVRTLDAEGNPDTRAGAHPDRLQVEFQLESEGTGTSARDYLVEFEPGLGGSPSAVPACPRPVFEGEEACPADTQVGLFRLQLGEEEPIDEPMYNVAPAPGQLAVFGVKSRWSAMFELDVRPGDYGLRLRSTQLPQFGLGGGRVELWGIPADHLAEPPDGRAALLTNPTRCGPLQVTLRTRSWEVGAPWLSESGESLPFTGCEGLPFSPKLDFGLTSRTVDSPAGARIDFTVPEHTGPDELVSSHLKDVSVDLPPGVTVSPGGVEGLLTCKDEQFGFGTERPVACPFLSRIGSVEISSPQVSEPLDGSVYLGQERPGERFRLFVGAAAGGIELKTVGRLASDPETGRLTAVLANLPQASLSRISLSLDGGPQALLATPITCGSVTAQGRFVPYSGGPEARSDSAIEIVDERGGHCPGGPPFSPGVVTGSTSSKAGHTTGFLMNVTRRHGEQLPSRFSVTLPPGLNARLGSVDLCPNALAGAGNCPGKSRIGSAVAEIGSGSSPALVRGDVYLTESYRRAPFGFVIVFQASVGPFDLGTLRIRGSLRVHRRSGQVAMETDLLPSVFEGIPLRFRTIGMDLDRPNFLRNPTSCKPISIGSTVHSVDGRAASSSTPFTMRGCNALGFRPRFRLKLRGRAAQRKGGHPGVRFDVRVRRGGANLSGFRVKFPRILAFRSAGITAICSRGDAIEGVCSRRARVGTGVARTPLLKKPLRGPIYLVQPKGNGLPDLWSSVAADGVEINLAGETLRRRGRLVTRVVNLPDIPLSKFSMLLRGGKKAGLFSLRRGLCTAGRRRSLFGPVQAKAQNGAYRLARIPVGTSVRCRR